MKTTEEINKAVIINPKIITDEERANFEALAKGYAIKHGRPKVNVYIGVHPETNERIVAYIKEPNFTEKLFAISKMQTSSPILAGNEMREALLLREESHPLTYGEGYECDAYKLGINDFCTHLGEIIQDSFKKK
jgi:hypothetical protein